MYIVYGVFLKGTNTLYSIRLFTSEEDARKEFSNPEFDINPLEVKE
jgi:hypothetical protein